MPQSDSKWEKDVSATKLKLHSKSPFKQQWFLEFQILGVEIWVKENLPSLSHNLSQFPLLVDCGSKFRIYCIFMHFLVFFFIGILISLLLKHHWPLFAKHCEFWICHSPQIITFKEPNERFGLFSHFWLLSQKCSPTNFFIFEKKLYLLT